MDRTSPILTLLLHVVLVVQLIVTNFTHIEALQSINNLLYLGTTFVLTGCFFTIRKENFWKIPRSQLFFEIFLVLILLVSLIKSDVGGLKIILTDFILFYFLIYGRKAFSVNISFINTLFLSQIGTEIVIGLLGGNNYAYLPFLGEGRGFYWQISLFSNGQTALSGALSCVILILNWYSDNRMKYLMIGLSLFFLIFSGSRTMLIIFGLIFFMNFITWSLPNLSARNVLLTTYILPVFMVVAMFSFIFLSSTGNSFLMEFFFRNFTADNTKFEQLDRFLLLKSYWDQFVAHPLMGISTSTDFASFADEQLKYVPTRGTETKLIFNLATFGISYLIFVVLIFYHQFLGLVKRNMLYTSIWVFYLISNLLYGSYMRGYTFICLLVFLILSNRVVVRESVEETSLATGDGQ